MVPGDFLDERTAVWGRGQLCNDLIVPMIAPIPLADLRWLAPVLTRKVHLLEAELLGEVGRHVLDLRVGELDRVHVGHCKRFGDQRSKINDRQDWSLVVSD